MLLSHFEDVLEVELWMKRDVLIKDAMESMSFCITSCSVIYHVPSFVHVLPLYNLYLLLPFMILSKLSYMLWEYHNLFLMAANGLYY
jgi:hypothetical protein